jgi:hypothetical protein
VNTPAYGLCTDHDAKRASLDAFASLTRHQMQTDGEGGWLLLGNCTRCGTTLAVPIALARGHVVHGTIDTPRDTDSEPPF